MTVYMIMLTIIVLAREYTNYKQEIKHDKMISELTDKLMARDFTEYSENTQPPKVYEPVEQTEESQYWQEVEDNKR